LVENVARHALLIVDPHFVNVVGERIQGKL
jgi:hypothetical protein